MSSPRARRFLVVCLLIVGAAGAYLEFDASQRHTRVFTEERATLGQLDEMLASVNELAVTQRGYFEPNRDGSTSSGTSGSQFQRVRQLTDELQQGQEVLRSRLTSPDAIEQLTVLTAALDAFTTTDTRVRTNLANETYFSAADLVFSASATELRSVTTALVALKDLGSGSAAAAFTAVQRRAGLIAGGVAFVWLIGLLLLAVPATRPAPTSDRVADEAPTVAAPAVPTAMPQPVESPELHHVENSGHAAAVTTARVDLEQVSRVCAQLARAGSAADLREVLADAAAALDASGMIVWLGAGEELFPVIGHGYDPRMLARIGPISRHAENATAVAWRTVETQFVSGDQGRTGAIVVPLVSATGCIGVLSAEVTPGSERSSDTRAVTGLFAAQMSTIVAAWPEPSGAASEHPPPHIGTVAVRL